MTQLDLLMKPLNVTSLAQDWGKSMTLLTHLCLVIFSMRTARCIYMYDFLLNEGP